MPLAATLPAAILETILLRLAALFLTGAGGDMTAARQAAAQMLAAYRPETTDELCLAANIIGFSFQALEALGQAAAPDMSLARTLRLRGSAVSLSRESHKAERRLDQLQKARHAGIPAQATETQPAPAQPEPKSSQPEATSNRQIAAKAGDRARAQAEEDRQRDLRIAAGLKRLEARLEARAAIATQAQPPGPVPEMLSAA